MRETLLLCLVGVAGCTQIYPHEFQGAWAGSASYTASLMQLPDGVVGAEPLRITIDDSPYDDDGILTFHIAPACTLAGNWVSRNADSRTGAFISATGSISAQQACALPVDGGVATMQVETGSAERTGATTLDLALAGNVHTWLGEASDGYLSLTFTSTR